MTTLAIIRIRGPVRVRKETEHALTLLGLKKRNHATLVEKTPTTLGTIRKIHPYITWGEATPDIITATQKHAHGKTIVLAPPLKGYGRKGIKIPFSKGGALGYRGEKINELLQRMMQSRTNNGR